KAEAVGYNPQVILAGRRINDNMGKFVAEKAVKLMLSNNHQPGVSKVGILGLTFKEDCPDLRNSRVVDIIDELLEYGIEPIVFDPVADRSQAEAYMNRPMTDLKDFKDLGALIIAVPHEQFREMAISNFTGMLSDDGCLLDVKSMLDPNEVPDGTIFWRL
ncbi:UDP binding domain-containing protein, partial [Thiolapillus sp.]